MTNTEETKSEEKKSLSFVEQLVEKDLDINVAPQDALSRLIEM